MKIRRFLLCIILLSVHTVAFPATPGFTEGEIISGCIGPMEASFVQAIDEDDLDSIKQLLAQDQAVPFLLDRSISIPISSYGEYGSRITPPTIPTLELGYATRNYPELIPLTRTQTILFVPCQRKKLKQSSFRKSPLSRVFSNLHHCQTKPLGAKAFKSNANPVLPKKSSQKPAFPLSIKTTLVIYAILQNKPEIALQLIRGAFELYEQSFPLVPSFENYYCPFLDCQDSFNHTALYYARAQGMDEVVQQLEEYNALDT